jgi:prolyl-tRNA editing enzyme YbaK/EbsC (Cys-tRNA(Pro) deacylase)
LYSGAVRRIGALEVVPARRHLDVLAPAVARLVADWPGRTPASEIGVVLIDPALADTAAFCARYGVPLDRSANCVVVDARRHGESRLAGCVVLASTRADVNGLVRQQLAARKTSFAALDRVVRETGMEYGGITPVGLPAGWPLLVDAAVAAADPVVVGSGSRLAKLVLPGRALGELPGAQVLSGLGC